MFKMILQRIRCVKMREKELQEREKAMQLELNKIVSIQLDLSKYPSSSFSAPKKIEEEELYVPFNVTRFSPETLRLPSFLKKDMTNVSTKANTETINQPISVQPVYTIPNVETTKVASVCTELQAAHLVVVYYGIDRMIEGNINRLNSLSIYELTEMNKKINRCTFGVYQEKNHQEMAHFLRTVKNKISVLLLQKTATEVLKAYDLYKESLVDDNISYEEVKLSMERLKYCMTNIDFHDNTRLKEDVKKAIDDLESISFEYKAQSSKTLIYAPAI